MDRSPTNPLGDLCRTDHRTPIVKYLHKVILLNAPVLCVPGIDPDYPVIVTVNEDPVVFDIVNEAALTVMMGMKAESDMWRYELQGVFFVQLGGMVTLPGRDILCD